MIAIQWIANEKIQKFKIWNLKKLLFQIDYNHDFDKNCLKGVKV